MNTVNNSFKHEFAELLKNTIIFNENEYEEKYTPIVHLVRDNIPKSLFRYRSCSTYHIDGFWKNEAYHAKPIQFNDPHDCLVYINEEYLHSLTSSIPELDAFKDLILNQQANGFKDIEKISPELFKLISSMSDEDIMDKLKEAPDLLNSANLTVNSLVEWIIPTTYKIFRTDKKIACFCEEIKSQLMWAHYADSHKGFAIEYNFKDLINPCVVCEDNRCLNREYFDLFPVIYSNERYDATAFAEAQALTQMAQYTQVPLAKLPSYDHLSTIKANLYKGYDWKYEKEWRSFLRCPNNLKQNYLRIKPIAIYLGLNIEAVNETILIHFALEKNIPVYKMRIKNDYKGFELDYEMITNNIDEEKI